MRDRRSIAVLIVLVLAAACTATATSSTTQVAPPTTAPSPGLQKLQHLIFIVQENRSFDQYFGTYPGADGIPTNPDGSFKPCIPDKYDASGACARPYVTDSFDQDGGPHNHIAATADVAGGAMDGFISAMHPAPHKCPLVPTGRRCDDYLGPDGQPDVMSTHDRATIPNYWEYADDSSCRIVMFAAVGFLDAAVAPVPDVGLGGRARRPGRRDELPKFGVHQKAERRACNSAEAPPIRLGGHHLAAVCQGGVYWGCYVGGRTCKAPRSGTTTKTWSAPRAI